MVGNRVKTRAGEKGQKLKTNWKEVFLEKLAETSNVTKACRACGALSSYVYRHRRKDAEFRRIWGEALLEGYEHLEMETLQRLRFGTGAGDTKFDIPNALRLLTVHRETVARERARQGKREDGEVLKRLTAKLEQMRERKLAAQKLLAEDGVVQQVDRERD